MGHKNSWDPRQGTPFHQIIHITGSQLSNCQPPGTFILPIPAFNWTLPPLLVLILWQINGKQPFAPRLHTSRSTSRAEARLLSYQTTSIWMPCILYSNSENWNSNYKLKYVNISPGQNAKKKMTVTTPTKKWQFNDKIAHPTTIINYSYRTNWDRT